MSITRGVEWYKFQLHSSFQQGVIYIGVCKEILSKTVGYSPCFSSRRERKRGREGRRKEGGRVNVTSSHLLSEFFSVFQVHLMEGLNVVGSEGNGNQHHLLLASLGQCLDYLVRLGAEPGKGTHLHI